MANKANKTFEFTTTILFKLSRFTIEELAAKIVGNMKITQQAKQEARAAGKEDTYINFCREHYHRQSLYDKAVDVCKQHGEPNLAQPVYLALKYFWNDIIEWASEQSKLEIQKPVWREEWESRMNKVYDKYEDKKVAA